MRFNLCLINVCLYFVRHQYRNKITLLCSFVGRHGFKTMFNCQIIIWRTFSLSDYNVKAAITKVLCMSMPLAAIADY